jgi:hypothetical protein
MASVTWRRDNSTPPIFTLEGVFDETATLADLAGAISGPAILDLRGVRRISSAGTRNWLHLMRRLPDRMILRACSRALVEQMNMLFDFTGGARVESVVVPFQCGTCERMENLVVHVSELRQQLAAGQLRTPRCANCRNLEMTLTEDPDGYFQFLRYVDAPT